MKELYHHGIKGQKWGVQNGPPYPISTGNNKQNNRYKYKESSKKNKSNNSIQTIQDKNIIRQKLRYHDQQNKLYHINHNRLVNQSQITGKSVAEIESKEKKFHLSDNQKKAIAIGVGVTVTALAAYGTYKYISNKKETAELNKLILDNLDTSSKVDTNNNLINDLVKSTVKTEDKTEVEVDFLDDIIESKVGPESGFNKFLKESFDSSNFSAYYNNDTNKKTLDDILTPSSSKWWTSLSDDEKKSIEKYTRFYYEDMNNFLWKAKGGDPSKQIKNMDDYNSEILHYINGAKSALSKSSFPENLVTTQGTTMDHACKFLGCTEEDLIKAATDKNHASNFLGAVNTNYGFFSTTTTVGLGSGSPGGVKYRVLTPKGAKAAYIEHISYVGDLPHPPSWDGIKRGGPPFSSEFETLIAPGSNFKTKNIRLDSTGCIEIALEYLLEN